MALKPYQISRYPFPIAESLGFETVRYGAIGDGSCFVHAVLRAINPEYVSDIDSRPEIARTTRENIASALTEEDWINISGEQARIEIEKQLRKILMPRLTKALSYRRDEAEKLFNRIIGIVSRKLRDPNKVIDQALYAKSIIQAIEEDINGRLSDELYIYELVGRAMERALEKTKKRIGGSGFVEDDMMEIILDALGVNVLFIDFDTNMPYIREGFDPSRPKTVIINYLDQYHFEIIGIIKKEPIKIGKRLIKPGKYKILFRNNHPLVKAVREYIQEQKEEEPYREVLFEESEEEIE